MLLGTWLCNFGDLETFARNKVEALQPLGYIPNLSLLSKNENKFRILF
jgi:hypothetical protein